MHAEVVEGQRQLLEVQNVVVSGQRVLREEIAGGFAEMRGLSRLQTDGTTLVMQHLQSVDDNLEATAAEQRVSSEAQVATVHRHMDNVQIEMKAE